MWLPSERVESVNLIHCLGGVPQSCPLVRPEMTGSRRFHSGMRAMSLACAAHSQVRQASEESGP